MKTNEIIQAAVTLVGDMRKEIETKIKAYALDSNMRELTRASRVLTRVCIIQEVLDNLSSKDESYISTFAGVEFTECLGEISRARFEALDNNGLSQSQYYCLDNATDHVICYQVAKWIEDKDGICRRLPIDD